MKFSLVVAAAPLPKSASETSISSQLRDSHQEPPAPHQVKTEPTHAIPDLPVPVPRTPEPPMEPNHALHHPSLKDSHQEPPAPHQVKTEPTHAIPALHALVPRTPMLLMEPNHALHHPSLKASHQ